jgi:DNA-binding transcriptional LysR family regulator
MKIYVNSVRYFLAVWEQRSFGGAARKAGISQPTLSLAIQRLENELGGRLFERSSLGTIGLTDLGRSLLPHFRKLDRCIDRMELAARTAIAEVGSRLQ